MQPDSFAATSLEKVTRASRSLIRFLELNMTKMPATAAERMRLYRQRRRQGIYYVRIPLHVTEINGLLNSPIGRGKDDPRTNTEVVQAAILELVYRQLEQK
jgi:hypothetical protein